MTPDGIELATFRFVARYLTHSATVAAALNKQWCTIVVKEQ